MRSITNRHVVRPRQITYCATFKCFNKNK
uniref:Uncharacterized protein n=1 Tax=Arundo donax TaxID=35708 RepID=A0A0A9CH28_ARUDO